MDTETYITKTGLHWLSVGCVRVGAGKGEIEIRVNGEITNRLPVEADRMSCIVSVPYHLNRGDHVRVTANPCLQPRVEAEYRQGAVMPLVLAGSETEFREWCVDHQRDSDNAYEAMQVLYPMDLAALEAVPDTWLVLVGSWRKRLAKDASLRQAVEYWLGRAVETPPDWRRCVTRWLIDPCQAGELVIRADGQIVRTNKAGILKFRHTDFLTALGGSQRIQVGEYTLSYLSRDMEYQYWAIIALPQEAS